MNLGSYKRRRGRRLVERLLSRLDHRLLSPLLDPFRMGLVLRVGPYLWPSRELRKTLGHPLSRLNRVDRWFRTLYGDRAERLQATYEEERAAGFPRPRVIPIDLAKGGRRHVAVKAGRLGPVELWWFIDVTTETAASERFRILFDQSSDAHLIFDQNGILDCNQAALNMLRLRTKEELLALHPAELSPEWQPDERRSDEKSLQMDRLARENGYHRFDWMHRRADGTDIPVEVTLTPVRLETGPALLTVWHDLTERYEREAALAAAKDAAEAGLQARRAFLATMSHELRTPMNGVLGLTDAVLETPLSDPQRVLVESIQASGQTLRALLDDILDFSKVEAGKIRLETLAFDLRKTCESLLTLHRMAADEKGVVLERDLASIEGALVWGDPTRTRQVLGNLLSNAVKFTLSGRVRLSAHRAEPGALVRIRVEDTGIGIAPQHLERIFDPFRQADASTTRRYGGTGLGLAIVSRLVEAMGGQISVESELGRGTTFTVTLPLPEVERAAEPAEPAEPQRAAPLVLPGKPDVLVVEDNAVNRSVLQHLFARTTARARFVEDGSLVAAAVKTAAPDVILMDVHMPEMDGLEATRRLRATGYNGPIVALTASCLDEELAACREAGMNVVLAKPVDRARLIETLRSLLGSGE